VRAPGSRGLIKSVFLAFRCLIRSMRACLEVWSTRNKKVRETERDSRRAAVFKSLEHITRLDGSAPPKTLSAAAARRAHGVLGAERGEAHSQGQ
jgi:hypothetical protein